MLTADITTGKPAIPAPPAERIPTDKARVSGVSEIGIKNNPSADKVIPIKSVFPDPNLSDIAPPTGPIAPLTSWPSAKAKLICR